MHNPIVRSEPTELLFVGSAALPATKTGHDLLDGFAGEGGCQEFGGLADQMIALSQSEGETASREPVRGDEFGDRIRVDRVTMNGVAPGAWSQGKTKVVNFDGGNGHGAQWR